MAKWYETHRICSDECLDAINANVGTKKKTMGQYLKNSVKSYILLGVAVILLFSMFFFEIGERLARWVLNAL